jgi:tetratricopeptide (TPR) repeat protein
MVSSRERRATTAGKWLLAVTVVVSGLAIGALLNAALVVVTIMAATACALLWIHPPDRTSRASCFVMAGALVLLGVTALQCVPLPAGLVAAISPNVAEIWSRSLAPLHEAGPAWHPLSVAPPSTHIELLRGVFYLCLFLGALRVSALERGGTFLQRTIVAAAVLMAVTALAHAAVGAERVFGVYKPRELYAYLPGRYGPLLNTNHLAAYCGMGACVAFGMLMTARETPRALSAGAALLLAATSVWASSRGGTGALVFGVVVTVALSVGIRQRRFDARRVETAVVAVALLAAGVMIALGASDYVIADLSGRDLSKLGIAKTAFRLVRDAPVFGVGRGAFETVFPSVRTDAGYFTFTNPENIAAQWLVEWGVPASLVAACLLGWGLRLRTVLNAARPAAGVWAALVATVLHELVDYHLEVPGVMALAVLCAAVVVGARARSGDEAHAPRIRLAAWAACAAAVPVALLVTLDRVEPLAKERSALAAAATDHALSAAAFRERVREAMLAYPAEPFFPLIGGVRAQVMREGSVVPWVARALERDPSFGRAHLVLARSLAARRLYAQARLEYRLAYEHDPALRTYVVDEASHLVMDEATALEIVPTGVAGVEALEGIVQRIGKRLPSTAILLDDEILRRSPNETGPLARRVDATVLDLHDDLPWCVDRTACAQDGLAAAERWRDRAPRTCPPNRAIAVLRAATGDVHGALDGLEHALDTLDDASQCERALIDLSLELKDDRRADAALDRLVRRGCGRAAECVELYTWAARMDESRRRPAAALALYHRAAELAPERDDDLVAIGRLASAHGMLKEAIDAYETLDRRHPDDPQWRARIADLRAEAQRRAFAPPH